MTDQTTRETRHFTLSAILTATTGRLLGDIGDLYQIVDYVLDAGGVTTIGLLATAQPIRAALLAQHPQLAGVDASGVTPENWRDWLVEQVATFGPSLPCHPVAGFERRTVADDVLDVIRLNPKAEIIVQEVSHG